MKTTTSARRTLTIDEAASALGVHRNTAYELVKKHEFPGAVRLGRRVLVCRDRFEQFLRGGKDDRTA